MAADDRYETDVFINCPFDPGYRAIFDAIVFASIDCGFRPRCALEVDDSGQNRIDKIVEIIRGCRFGIHDLSRTELDAEHRLPRFNMPFELGLFLAAKWFGGNKQKRKICLILDSDRYRYQKFLSDIAGQDIRSHDDQPGRRSASFAIGFALTSRTGQSRAAKRSAADTAISAGISRGSVSRCS